jgi:hypothetical protein
MTDEQIDLEFQHIIIDKQNKDGVVSYEDDEYDKYDEETAEEDERLSDLPRTYDTDTYNDNENDEMVRVQENKDDWEDVEIDDQ